MEADGLVLGTRLLRQKTYRRVVGMLASTSLSVGEAPTAPDWTHAAVDPFFGFTTAPRCPLSPGISLDSTEIFGFVVYELRVGHAQGRSTAQRAAVLPGDAGRRRRFSLCPLQP